MCHLLLVLPLLALPVFWFFPWPVATALYGVALLIALLTYAYAFAATRKPLEIGRERLLNATGIVTAVSPVLRVRVGGESWSAQSREPLAPGEPIIVESVDGLKLQVRRRSRVQP